PMTERVGAATVRERGAPPRSRTVAARNATPPNKKSRCQSPPASPITERFRTAGQSNYKHISIRSSTPPEPFTFRNHSPKTERTQPFSCPRPIMGTERKGGATPHVVLIPAQTPLALARLRCCPPGLT